SLLAIALLCPSQQGAQAPHRQSIIPQSHDSLGDIGQFRQIPRPAVFLEELTGLRPQMRNGASELGRMFCQITIHQLRYVLFSLTQWGYSQTHCTDAVIDVFSKSAGSNLSLQVACWAADNPNLCFRRTTVDRQRG